MKKIWNVIKNNINIAIFILIIVLLSLIINYWNIKWTDVINAKIIPFLTVTKRKKLGTP